ncbi:MAG: ABC transporter permease, partial [Acidimicrobiia bacterium]
EDAGFDAALVDTADAARTAVDDDQADAALLIPPPSFSGEPAPIVVYGDLDAGLAITVAESIAASVGAQTDTARLVLDVTGDPAAAAAVGGATPPVSLVQATTGDRVLDGITYLAVGMALFFLFFSVQGGILNIIEERTNGTLRRLLVAPVGRGAILLGKTLSSALAGLLSMVVLAVATTLSLGADWGPWYGVVLLSVAGVIAAMGLGALIGTIARTAEQAGNFAGIAATVLGLLGGVFFPISTGPGFFDAVTRLSPHRWLLEGFGANAGTAPFTAVLAPALVVAGFGVVTGLAAYARRSKLTGVV